MAKVKVKGKCKWAYIKNLDTKYAPTWKITVFCQLPEAKKLRALGLKVTKVDEDMNPELAELGPYSVKITRLETKRGKAAGQKNLPPIVIDADNEPFEEILGDGSDVVVTFNTYNWNNNFGSGVGTDLEKVKVVNLIPYSPKEETITVEDENESKEDNSGGNNTTKDTDDIPF